MLNRKSNGGHPEGAAAASTLPVPPDYAQSRTSALLLPSSDAKLHIKNVMNNKNNMFYNIKWKIKMMAKKLKMVAVLTDGDPSRKI